MLERARANSAAHEVRADAHAQIHRRTASALERLQEEQEADIQHQEFVDANISSTLEELAAARAVKARNVPSAERDALGLEIARVSRQLDDEHTEGQDLQTGIADLEAALAQRAREREQATCLKESRRESARRSSERQSRVLTLRASRQSSVGLLQKPDPASKVHLVAGAQLAEPIVKSPAGRGDRERERRHVRDRLAALEEQRRGLQQDLASSQQAGAALELELDAARARLKQLEGAQRLNQERQGEQELELRKELERARQQARVLSVLLRPEAVRPASAPSSPLAARRHEISPEHIASELSLH